MLSFHAPYKCRKCNHRFKALIDVYVHRQAIADRAPPVLTCPNCSATEARYEGTPEQFATLASAVSPPESGGRTPLRQAMDAGSPQLSRHVEGETTRLVLVGEMATSVRWRSAMDGLGGELVVDLTQVSAVSGGGVSPLVTAMQAASGTVSGMVVIGCPVPVAHALRANPIPGLRFKSIAVDTKCDSCRKKGKVIAELGTGTLDEALAKPVNCPHCGSKIKRKDANLPSRTIPLNALLTLTAVIAAIGLVVVLAGVVLAGVEGIRQRSEALTPQGAAGEDAIHIDDKKVAATGHGGPYGTVDEAQAAARDKALGVIVSALSREIVSKRGSTGGAVDVPPSAVQRFLDAVGVDPATLLEDTKTHEGEGGFEVDATYALPRAKFDEIVSAYAEEREWGPLHLVRPFPPAPGLRVVKSSLDGVEPGTRVVRIGELSVDALAQLPEDTPGVTILVQDADGTERSVAIP